MDTIQSRTSGRNNNFDLLRLVAAIMVIFSHAFPLSWDYSNGVRHRDWLWAWSQERTTFGDVGVAIFFIISGFLISHSFSRSSTIGQFFKARILRIFPALAVMSILMVFVLGPLTTSVPLRLYFTSTVTFKFLVNIVLHYEANLPGVFTHNSFPSAVNGSIWTLYYEFFCYMLLALIGFLGFLKRKSVTILLFLVVSVVAQLKIGGYYTIFLQFFAAGMIFYTFREHITLKNTYAAMAAVGMMILSVFYISEAQPLLLLCGAYLVFWTAYHPKLKGDFASKHGDLSYGTYIYAFPMQQTVTWLFRGHMATWLNFLIALPIVLLLAIGSWHLVEKRALRLKYVRSTKLTRSAQSV